MDVSAPIALADAREAKAANIVEIALDFSGMLRVFEKGSNAKIIPKLREFFDQLDSIGDKAAYDTAHAEFCTWFAAIIKTAEKKLKSGEIKPSVACSYGHGAKVLDIAAKVYVYYCGQPSAEIARKLVPMLHCALDTPMMTVIDKASGTIQEVDREGYERLQACVRSKVAGQGIDPVQYDDVMWRRLQRAEQISSAQVGHAAAARG
jgi:hypothetical protein